MVTFRLPLTQVEDLISPYVTNSEMLPETAMHVAHTLRYADFYVTGGRTISDDYRRVLVESGLFEDKGSYLARTKAGERLYHSLRKLDNEATASSFREPRREPVLVLDF